MPKFVAKVVTQVTKSVCYILFLILEDVPEKINLSNRVCVVKTRFLNLFTTNNFL